MFSISVQQESPCGKEHAVRLQLASNASLSRNMRAGHAKLEASARWKTHLEPEPGLASGMLSSTWSITMWLGNLISEGV
jgi:hypothetical protein